MHVAIVGGGIIGLASARYPSVRGADVRVFEKSSLGSGSTGRANGGIHAQFTSGVSVALSRERINVWNRFNEEFGIDINYLHTDYLFLARTPDSAKRFRKNIDVQKDNSVPSEYFPPEEAREQCPGLYADRYVGATYSPVGEVADPHLALQVSRRAPRPPARRSRPMSR